MNVRRAALCVSALAALAVIFPQSTGYAGPFDSLKKKADKKAQEEAKKATQGVPGVPDSTPAPGAPAASDAPATGSAAGGAGGEKVSQVSTKFDFVSGDSVIFFDDLQGDELGEFPANWQLVEGAWEVAELDGERWLRCTSTSGTVRMKVPPSFPEYWTLEFDFYNQDGSAIALHLTANSESGSEVWQTRFPYSGQNLEFHAGQISSNTPLEGLSTGRHHVMFMARGTALKVYVDRQRMANVPDVTGPGKPAMIDFTLGSSSKPMITNVRFAEGCRPAPDMLAKKLVTYGIHFATGSDQVLPDSAPILRQVAAYLKSNATVKVKITGHTDNVGASESNLDLSKRRAASVAKVLAEEFEVPAERLAADGKGDTEAVADNKTAAGRAMNRRVEFAKM
jgi:outer membrane protein OmpA-like peptidoglycan-associated protein